MNETAIKFRSNKFSPSSRPINALLGFVIRVVLSPTGSGVTEDEKRLILEEHNYLRQTVATGHVPGQPSAQNMQEMTWDDELAAKAQQWANECTFQHDPSRYLGESCATGHRKLFPCHEIY